MINLTPLQEKELKQLLMDNKKIQAVAKVHEWTNAGLRNAKEFVDKMSK